MTTFARLKKELDDFLSESPSLDKPIRPLSEPDSNVPANISFYDRHIDASLDLQRVHVVTSLTDRLARITKSRMETLREQNLPSTTLDMWHFHNAERRRAVKHTTPFDSYLPSRDYRSTTPSFLGAVASMLYFWPHLSELTNLMLWSHVTKSYGYPLIDDRPGLVLADVDDPLDNWSTFPPERRKELSDAKSHSPALCIFQFYDDPVVGHEILLEMDHFTAPDMQSEESVTDFPSPAPSPYGDLENSAVVNRLISPPDEINNSPPMAKLPSGKRKAEEEEDHESKESRKKPKIPGPRPFSKISVQISEKQPQVLGKDRARALLRHAWARLVATNSSFVVFNCGTFERIGIRDRENQTLYLSEIIPIYEAQKPGYLSVMTGLYLAILEDVHTRVPQRQPSRRMQSTRSSLCRSQPRTRGFESMITELKDRKLVLLLIKYQGLNSSSPSAFIRCGKFPLDRRQRQEVYGPSDYILVTIKSEIARGNTGVVHTASLKLILPEDAIQTTDAIVKIAMGPEQCRRLRKETLAYIELSNSVTEGIPQMYGLFEDVQNDVLIIIMEHVGECLLTLFPDAFEDSGKPVVAIGLRRRYADILERIHAAGYVHRDIRPENLTMDNRGNVFFIDFDRARRLGHPIPQEKKTDEFESLESVLHGYLIAMLSPTSTQLARDRERDRLEYEQKLREKNARAADAPKRVDETANDVRNQENTEPTGPGLGRRYFIGGVEASVHVSTENGAPGAKKRYIINGVEYEEVGSGEEETDTDTSGEGSSKAEEGSDAETEGSRTERRDEGGTSAEGGEGESES